MREVGRGKGGMVGEREKRGRGGGRERWQKEEEGGGDKGGKEGMRGG